MRLLLTGVILFHLVGVLITPNQSSYLTQALSPVYRPYMNFFGLGSSWGFFAPEPVYPPMYIDYVIERKEGEPIEGRFPDENNPYFFRDRHNRRMSMSRFILGSDEHIKNMFVHYLCIQHQKIQAIKLWRVTGTQPTLLMVQTGQKRMTDPVDFKIEVLGTYYCAEGTP